MTPKTKTSPPTPLKPKRIYTNRKPTSVALTDADRELVKQIKERRGLTSQNAVWVLLLHEEAKRLKLAKG